MQKSEEESVAYAGDEGGGVGGLVWAAGSPPLCAAHPCVQAHASQYTQRWGSPK